MLSDVICKRIQLLETDIRLLGPDHDDIAHLQVGHRLLNALSLGTVVVEPTFTGCNCVRGGLLYKSQRLCPFQAQIDQLKHDKVTLENQLEQESESIVLRLNREKRDLEAEAAKLKAELSKVGCRPCRTIPTN